MFFLFYVHAGQLFHFRAAISSEKGHDLCFPPSLLQVQLSCVRLTSGVLLSGSVAPASGWEALTWSNPFFVMKQPACAAEQRYPFPALWNAGSPTVFCFFLSVHFRPS